MRTNEIMHNKCKENAVTHLEIPVYNFWFLQKHSGLNSLLSQFSQLLSIKILFVLGHFLWHNDQYQQHRWLAST